MKKTLWVFTLGIGFFLGSSGQLLAQDSCLVTDWDTVIGGSVISGHIVQGQCSYEVDTENGPNLALLQNNLPASFEDSGSHQIRFTFSAAQLNQAQKGAFKILALNAKSVDGVLFSLNLSWNSSARNRAILILEGDIHPELQNPLTGAHPESPLLPAPLEIEDGFDGWIEVTVNFTQSSAPGISDGAIELWIDDTLASVWTHLALDWPNELTPKNVSYGVVEIMAPQTSGKLGIVPQNPSPSHPDF